MMTIVRAWLNKLNQWLHPSTSQEDALVEVYRAANQGDAALAIALLASENIPAISSGESVGSVYGLQVGSLAELKILVHRKNASLAQAIIDQRYTGTGPDELAENWWQEEGEEH